MTLFREQSLINTSLLTPLSQKRPEAASNDNCEMGLCLTASKHKKLQWGVTLELVQLWPLIIDAPIYFIWEEVLSLTADSDAQWKAAPSPFLFLMSTGCGWFAVHHYWKFKPFVLKEKTFLRKTNRILFKRPRNLYELWCLMCLNNPCLINFSNGLGIE